MRCVTSSNNAAFHLWTSMRMVSKKFGVLNGSWRTHLRFRRLVINLFLNSSHCWLKGWARTLEISLRMEPYHPTASVGRQRSICGGLYYGLLHIRLRECANSYKEWKSSIRNRPKKANLNVFCSTGKRNGRFPLSIFTSFHSDYLNNSECVPARTKLTIASSNW